MSVNAEAQRTCMLVNGFRIAQVRQPERHGAAWQEYTAAHQHNATGIITLLEKVLVYPYCTVARCLKASLQQKGDH